MNFARNTSNLVVSALLCCASSAANAADATATGSVKYQVLKQLVITEATQLNFGKIDKPVGGAQKFVISTAGVTSIMNDGGTGGAFIGGHSAGSFTVTGTDGESVRIRRSTGDPCSNRTVELENVTIPSPNDFKLPATIPVGGVLIVSDRSTPGAITCPYTLTAIYQ